MAHKKLYLTLLSTIYFAISINAQVTLKEGNKYKTPQKVVEILAKIPQKSIKLRKGQRLKINDFQNQEKAQITLSDLSGKIVLQEKIFAYNPLSSHIDLNTGTYLLSVSVDDNKPTKSILVINN